MKPVAADSAPKTDTDPIAGWGILSRFLELEPNPIREILKLASRPEIISFAGGMPAPELFPVTDLKAAAERVFTKHGSSALQYSLSMGILPLRKEIADRETADGAPTTTDNIMMTTGAQQGLDMLAHLFIEPGDYILANRPTYVGALHTFNTYGPRYIDMPQDDEGMILDDLDATLAKYRPKFIYIVASFQNPTGNTMSLARRQRMVEIAAKHNVPILDDDPYLKLRFDGETLPTFKALGGDSVISLRSFSKTVTPGLRLGWMNASASFLKQIEKLKQATDLHTPSLNQFIMLEYILSGRFEQHIDRIRTDYAAKRDLMHAEMTAHFPKSAKWLKPDGGMFLWVELPDSISTTELLPKAIEQKVVYVPGAPFYPNKGNDRCLRLNYSNASKDEIVEGINRLAKLLKSVIL